MNIRAFSHLGNQALLRRLAEELAHQHVSTATLLALIAEVDERLLYLPAGYPSMYSYCVHELHLTREAALKRIHAARAARQFEGVLDAVAEGRVHLSGVVMLAPKLTPENAGELLAAATHKTKAEIELLLAECFPQPDLPTRMEALAPPLTLGGDHADVQEQSKSHAPGRVESPAPWPRVAPLSAERYALQVTIGRGTHDKLRYVQALLGHAVPSADLAEVLDRTLDAAIVQLEKRKFAATSRPRPQRCSSSPRHIPASVKRTVWERDGGQCSFVGENGNRCPARSRLEFDHVDPVARGGEATVEGIRLRCRAHNQYEAECVFGAGFMSDKRAEARAEARRQAKARAAATQNSTAPATEPSPEPSDDRDVTPYIRKLGYSAERARHVAALCASIPNASLEERVRFALKHLMPPHRRVPATAT
jgi:5-methylcytosine-specific restriction endonuclease McrA